jgi:hypothetical protein
MNGKGVSNSCGKEAGHENKDLLTEAINSFRLFDILKLWEAVHLPWEAVPGRLK